MANVNDILSNQQFLDWYFATTPESIVNWEVTLDKHPEWQPAVKDAVEWLQSIRVEEKSPDRAQVKMAYSKLQHSLKSNETEGVVVFSKQVKRWWFASAAAVLLAFAGVWFFNDGKNNSINTRYGEISEKVLPDGSEVTLNAHSVISYKNDWEKGKEREVWLKGEAYFHVKRTPRQSRFIVHTDRFDIVVTGTQFNVVNREGKTSVLLNEGSVTIKSIDGKEIKMLPGDYVEVKDESIQKSELQNANQVTAWKEKKMLFDSTTIQEAAKMIEETYGVNVKIEESAAAKTISGIMPNDNLDVLLQALDASDFVIEKTGNNIIIK